MPNLPDCLDARSASRAELERAADALSYRRTAAQDAAYDFLTANDPDHTERADDSAFKEESFDYATLAQISDARQFSDAPLLGNADGDVSDHLGLSPSDDD